MNQVKKWSGILSNNLTGKSLNHITWKYETFEGATHNSSDVIAILQGLKF
jgi:hypothetical protein